jgi:hypothetical protein
MCGGRLKEYLPPLQELLPGDLPSRVPFLQKAKGWWLSESVL